MATVTAQSTRRSGASANYAGKDAVAISAVNAPSNPIMFEKRLGEIRATHGKDGVRPMHVLDEAGKKVRDENGEPVLARDDRGQIMYESEYVQAYPIVQSFGLDELDPDDPASWDEAQRRGRALAERIGDGRPALIATEVNGRTGCVHNHIIIGAVHPETGRSLRSDAVTHSRLSITHDKVLEELGVEQRDDMRELTRQAEERMAEARQQIMDDAEKDLSPNQLRKRIEAAEKQVKLERTDDAPTPRQKQQDRLQREFERYQLNEQTRDAAAEIGAPGPKERFSEIELKGRVRETLADVRATDWQRLDEVGRRHGVTITKYTKRSRDVSFGMMLVDENGLPQEPANAHRRKGSRLGEGYRVEDVEAALERNRELAQAKSVSGPAAEHQRAMGRIGEESQHGAERMLQQWAKERKPAPRPAETPAVETPVVEEPSEQQKAAERVERDDEEFHQRLAEREREAKQRHEDLMANAPAELEAPEVETQEIQQPEAEEPQVQTPEAEQPQVPESKWSKLKERDAERTAPEPVEQSEPVHEPVEQVEPERPEPAKLREPGQEKSVGLLAEDQMQDREIIAVVTERGDGTAYVDWQLAHHDPLAKDKKGLHLIAEHGKAEQVTLDEKQYQKLQEAAGANRTEVDGDRVFAVRGDLMMMQGDKPTAHMSSVKPSEHQIGPDVLQKQQAAEDAAREKAREAYERNGQQMELKLPEHEKEKDPKERPDITD